VAEAQVQAPVREKILTGNFVVAVMAMHLYFFAYFSTFTAVPLFLEDAPDWQIGLVVGIFGVPSVFARPLAGRMTDRYGRKTAMILGSVVTLACFALYGLSTNLAILLPLRLLNGAIMGFFTTGNIALVADIAPAARRGETMGYHNFVNTAAQIYSPWAGLLLVEHAGLDVYWIVATAAMVACTVLVFMTKEPHGPRRAPGPMISRAALLPFAVFACLTTGFSTFAAFLTPYADEGLGNAGLWFAVLGLAMLAVRISSGVLADRFGRLAVTAPGIVLTAAGLLLLGGVQLTPVFYLSAVVFGLGFGACHTSLMALTIDRVPPNERGAALAQFLMAWDVGQAMGTIPMGVLVGVLDFSAAFVAGGVIAVVALPLLLRGMGPRATPAPVS
jgi:MFS family permease